VPTVRSVVVPTPLPQSPRVSQTGVMPTNQRGGAGTHQVRLVNPGTIRHRGIINDATPQSLLLTASSLFRLVQPETGPYPPAPFALAITPMIFSTASYAPSGMVPLCSAKRTARAASSIQQGTSCAQIGSSQTAAPPPLTTPATSVLDVASRLMGLKIALERRKLEPASPYNPEAWQRHLHAAGLQDRYTGIPDGLRFGFDTGIPPIFQTFTLPNHSSTTLHNVEFNNIIQTEFQKGHYIGPATCEEVESLLWAFQTSPLSIIPKPGQLGKFRIIQNLSSLHSPLNSITSINSTIDSNQYPCTWGTFAVICLLIRHLPPGSQAAVRDVKEAYRTVPIKPDQWPGLVIHLNREDSFAIDT